MGNILCESKNLPTTCHGMGTVASVHQKALLPPATKLGEGNIFRSVCQEFCPGGCAWQRGRVWQWGVHGRGACMAGGMCGGGHAWQGVSMAGGHAWQEGVHGRGTCVAGGCAWQILQDTVNEWAVRILLECILVILIYSEIGHANLK